MWSIRLKNAIFREQGTGYDKLCLHHIAKAEKCQRLQRKPPVPLFRSFQQADNRRNHRQKADEMRQCAKRISCTKFHFFPITVSIISSPLYQVVFNTTSCDIGIVSQYVCHFKGFLNFFKKNLRHSMKYYIMKNMNIFEIEVRTHEHI